MIQGERPDGTGQTYIEFEIPLKLPSLNDYVRECRRNAFAGARMKKQVQEYLFAFIYRLPAFDFPVFLSFHWVEKNLKRDLDNIAFGKKFILDALVENGKLKGDGQKWVRGFTDTFSVGQMNKVIVQIERADFV